jgi:hypothetical protein
VITHRHTNADPLFGFSFVLWLCEGADRRRSDRTMVAVSPLFGRVAAVILFILGSARMGLGIFAYRTANALERPSYSVLQTIADSVEIRRYEPYVVAETQVATGSMRKGTGTGFRTVAGYIFGKNKGKGGSTETMKMTAPVRVEAHEDKTKVSFVLGRAYSRRSAPVPLDRSVRLKDVKPHLLATRTFAGGPPSERRVARERQRIIAALEASGLQPASEEETLVYGYHDPFMTPGFLRRNEVCVRVQDSPSLSERHQA